MSDVKCGFTELLNPLHSLFLIICELAFLVRHADVWPVPAPPHVCDEHVLWVSDAVQGSYTL